MDGVVTPKANEIVLNINLYRKANDAGVTLSQYLESIDPADKYNDGLDAFERQLKRFGIITKSIPEKGIWASKLETFYTADDGAQVPYLFPEFVNRVAREALMQDDILSEMLAVRTPIDSNAYRAIYLNHDAEAASMKRVAQGTEIPVSTMTVSDKAINIHKYGRRLKATYEAIRRMRLDLLALHIKAVMKQASLDRAADAYAVLLNGDGNANAATNYNKTALQGGAAADPLAYNGWLAYMFKFFPYKMTTVIGGEDELISLLTIDAPNVDPLKLIQMIQFGNAGAGGKMAQNIFNDYRIVYLPGATANTLVGFDKQYSLEMVSEIGSDLVETQKLVSSQWNEIVISEVNGFAVFLGEARRSLTLNA